MSCKTGLEVEGPSAVSASLGLQEGRFRSKVEGEALQSRQLMRKFVDAL